MKIVWFSWKDHAHPAAGGAEVVKRELAKKLAEDGHELIILTSKYKITKNDKESFSSSEETFEGYKIIRVGGRVSLYYKAWRYYKKHLNNWPDLCIDEINTVPFFTRFYFKTKCVLFVHQLARKIWFYELPLPFSFIGYIAEPVYLWILRKSKVITVSLSSKNDLLKYGYKSDNISIIPEAIQTLPDEKILKLHKKNDKPTLILFGAIRSMKQTLHGVKAFELAKKNVPGLQLIIAGKSFGKYGKKVTDYCQKSEYRNDIHVMGSVDQATKYTLMQQAHFIVVTSVKEGWGLIVSEAGICKTPAIVYDVDGLRDAVGLGSHGLISKPNILDLSKTIEKAFSKKTNYDSLSKKTHDFSASLSYSKTYNAFIKVLNNAQNELDN